MAVDAGLRWNNRFASLGPSFHTRLPPHPLPDPYWVGKSRAVAGQLGLSDAWMDSPVALEVFAGNLPLSGSAPLASVYSGHQFGQWAGQLGDGRAIFLGEVVNGAGQRFELQLKGAGPTPYSRRADGRAVLRSSIREFLCSEAMHHLGVPTTRALSLVTTGEAVVRDMFYDGNPVDEPGAVVCRVAPSFIRFGHFELPASRGDEALLRRLVEFTIARDFPDFSADPDDGLIRWFAERCERTARLMVHWMWVGFVHGVMNTDNMSILGLTIDYGPYGWVDDFDPSWTPNTTDASGRRYCFGRQPEIARWNLERLAEALAVIEPDHDGLGLGLTRYDASQRHAYANLQYEYFWGKKQSHDLKTGLSFRHFILNETIGFSPADALRRYLQQGIPAGLRRQVRFHGVAR